ncbi:MYND-type domain-containing protein [Mycena venus]|uniref:MYND-type domain-containing protein n=1 Tax=Mycena venus TaxID=2733690 RepID=A0A8H6Y549_9AGAR|nr:MYND-type domain-containing protein [Mycena venus]
MPSFMILPSKDRCYCCDGPGNPELRKCSRCQLARYCSSECQRLDWKKHKKMCKDHTQDLQAEGYEFETPMEKAVKMFRKWVEEWGRPLMVWGMFAADLANREPNFLVNYSFFVRLEKRPQTAKQPGNAKYQVLWAGMRADAEILCEFELFINSADHRAQTISDFRQLIHRPDVLRLIVSVPSHELFAFSRKFITAIFREDPELGQAAFSDPLSTNSRFLSTGLAQAWSTNFMEHVRDGNTSGYIAVLRDLQGMTKTMNDLD